MRFPFSRKRKREPLTAAQIGDVLAPHNPWPWLEVRLDGPNWHTDAEVATVLVYNRVAREGYKFQFTTTDCYVTVWVKRPLYGESRFVRHLDSDLFSEKYRTTFLREMQPLGWLERPADIYRETP